MGIVNSTPVPTLAVTDVKKAREFYSRVLGLEEIESLVPGEGSEASQTSEAHLTYRVGDGYLYVYERPTPSGSTATACVFPVEDVKEAVQELRSRGIRFEEYDLPDVGIKTKDGIATMGDFQSAWFVDPSGNILAVDNSAVMLREQASRRPARETAQELHS